MPHLAPLQESAESYLKSIISEASGGPDVELDSLAPFGELGIDSFRVLKILKRLEGDFGRLPKTLLFEHFSISALASYFVDKHEQTLSAKLAVEWQAAPGLAHTNGRHLKQVAVLSEVVPSLARANSVAAPAESIRILEKEAYEHPQLKALVRSLFDRYKMDGCISRGTRKIAPNLFIGSAQLGYFNYGRSNNIILAYGYAGPRDYVPALVEEMCRYCAARNLQLNILADEEMPAVGDTSFSATPFGALQRIIGLREFTLEGGAMRRLRYQVSKFQKSGVCKTEEHQCGGNPETDKAIASLIDRWCAAKTMVNPLVHDVKTEILAGSLGSEHRLFVTWLDGMLQNVILIAPMCAEENGYLMDLEFYPPDMPTGGLEFAIVQIIGVLAAEGCDVLSLGGTYGCKLISSANANPEIDMILDDLRRQNIFNDEGNFQFKNKFRPENKTIFLCRPVGSGDSDNVVDIIMMIADPDKMQTSDSENHNFSKSRVTTLVEAPAARDLGIEGNERSRALSNFGFNPLNIPYTQVEFDLKTDSWAQLQMPSIDAQMRDLHAQIQQPGSLDESVRAVFPLAYFVLTASGQAAESIFFKAWPKKGLVPQNVLFPSTIFHQIDQGFTTRELPHPAVFHLNSQERYKGNIAWEELQVLVAEDPRAIAFVCIEVSDNAAGGHPVSIQHLRQVKALLAEHSIPLVMDGTRVVENAQALIEQEEACAGKTVWAVVREIFSYADAVIASLTKDFCINKGGIVATNDIKLFHRLQELVYEEGGELDLIDRKMIALSLQNRGQIAAKVLRRMENVRLVWRALNEHNVPIMHPAGGHCILIDVKQIPEFTGFKYPLASFLAWMYLNTGIRAAAHSVGMQKRTSINDLVRLAIPVGLNRGQIDIVIERLVHAFKEKVNIPEIAMESSAPQPLGAVYANYALLGYHHVAGAESNNGVLGTGMGAPRPPASAPLQASPKPVAQEARPGRSDTGRTVPPAQDIAIVGMAGRYPKSKNLTELWENLTQSRDCIEDLPADRYEKRLQHGSTGRYRGGFIDDVDKFDSLFFNISPREAEMLDPQERLFLEVAWEAIEDAGYYPESLAREGAPRSIGVFVGAVWTMYQMLGVDEKHAGNTIVPNSFLWSIANRVSHWFNFSGPSLTVDTACSSSLTALYLACESIYAGECSAAIVGGVNLDLHQAKLDINKAGGALSVDGVCRSFGKGANGYVAGEGIGALLLKPLKQAEADGDNIYGLIKSAVINHGGRTSGYTVPNPKVQTSLIVSALRKANIGAQSIGYIEAHGTGTELGDPIEIAGLSQAFRADNVENQTCAIGSIKSNIGHLEAAAGVVSISKVLLQMKHRRLVPSLHSSELNEFIDFKSSPFYVVQRVEDWKAKQVDGVQLPLRAGISSFGAGGSNAHIILENYEPGEHALKELVETRHLIFPLSARNEDQLRETAVNLAQFLQRHRVDLNDAACTLQIGRQSFDHRLAIIASTKEELLEGLACFTAARKSENMVTGRVKSAEGITRLLNRSEKEEFVRWLSQSRDPNKLAELWVEGLLTGWHGVQSPGAARKVSLPTYPFADKRHWAYKKSAIHSFLQAPAAMHPLMDTNESTFERQLFKKTFNDRDFFIYDHVVAGIPTLPGVAYLELARKAGEIAAGKKVQKIRNVVWVSPIAVLNSTPKEVFIELKPSQATVRFEVFSLDEKGNQILHCQGSLLYATSQEAAAEPQYVDLDRIRSRCAKVIDGKQAYSLFKSFGLNLGPSFQVLQEVYKNDNEIVGVLQLPAFRQGDLASMVLQPSLVDGSLQAGMGAQLGEKAEEMFVPFSIGEVEILYPLQAHCFSYVTAVKEDKKGKAQNTRLAKSNVLILDEAGKVLVKILECIGVPLHEVHKTSANADGFSELYYSYEWEPASVAVKDAPQRLPLSLVLFDTKETLRDLYRDRVRETGASFDQIILVRPGERFQDLGKQSYEINPQHKDDFTQLFASLIEKQCPLENICFAWPVGDASLHHEKPVEEFLQRGVYAFLFLCQALIKQHLENKTQLLYLYSTKPDETQPHNEAVGGFVKTLRIEHPRLLCKTLEVRQEGVDYKQILEAVSAELEAHAQDAAAVRYEAQERSIRKLKAFDFEKAATSPGSQGIGLREKGVYLITGGAGGLGLIFAEYLIKRCNARLVLSGRSELSAALEARLEEIRKTGAELHYVRADVSSYDEVTSLVRETKNRFGEIHGVIHAAGVLKDSLIRNKTSEEMSAVFASKVYGTLHLDEATRSEKLDFFVTFSSLAAVTGNAGQCDYSFANHFMDSFAAGRESLRTKETRSGKTLSVNWSLWADGGMKLDAPTELYFKKTLGIKPLSAEMGIQTLVKGLASERTQFAALEGVQEKVELAWGLRKKKPVPAAPAAVTQTVTPLVSPTATTDILASLQHDLSQIVMHLLKLDPADMATDKILLDLGFDSIGLTTFANAVNEKYRLDITPVLFFDYPSIDELAKHLSTDRKDDILAFYGGSTAASALVTPPAATQTAAPVGDKTPQEAVFKFSKGWDAAALDRRPMPLASPAVSSPENRFVNMPIAIVGMSGVMPQSEDLGEFWQNLKNSKDMITVIPPDRWRWEDYYGDPLKEVNKSNSRWGGFMNEVDKFDPLFFGISPREAGAMDPQQRIFLEMVWKAIEDSGHKVSDLSGTRTGLFVGAGTNDYVDVMNGRHIALDAYSASGNSHSVLANRVSFLLNLRGPSAPIDTACSSSLVALHRAIESIHTGSSDMAIVGGVQVMLSPAAYISFSMAGMLSSDGKCKTFDKQANGYVRGEGCGAIFLKPLSAAEADGNHIYAVVKATAENHGGRVSTLTAPNSGAQSSLLIEAYEKAKIDPTTVGYIECHGTGTSLGDPIEIQALSKAFAELYKRHDKAPAQIPHCGLSSVKTNIGHLETAAGIASVLKVLLAIKHKQIPATIHFEEINPYIKLDGTPFYIADKLTAWAAAMDDGGSPVPRRAGVSSFGFGGANAHIVLEEYIPAQNESSAPARGPQLIVLSAKNEDRLKAYILSMRTYLETEEVDLAHFAYTLQVGRDEMPERLALVVSSTGDLKHKLSQLLAGSETPQGTRRNNIKSAKPQTADGGGETFVQALIEQKDLSKLAELWVSGVKIEWRLLYDSDLPKRISAPTYPFARDRHWLPSAKVESVQERPAQAQIASIFLHPLIHRNVSTLEEHKFASRFSGEEFYLTDHVVESHKILPAVAYLEMARAAGKLSRHAEVCAIRGVTWERPLLVGKDGEEVEISLTQGKNEVKFSIKSLGKDNPAVHCNGRLVYSLESAAPAMLDIREIQARCSQLVMSGKDLYSLWSDSGLKHGSSFQVVHSIYANESESLAILQLPEHLKVEADQFWLHPALMDGSLHTIFGLVVKNGLDMPLNVPYSLGELQIFHPLKDLCYGYATWAGDSPKANQNLLKVNFHLLDKDGRVLVRMIDFVSRPFHRGPTKTITSPVITRAESMQGETNALLQWFVPAWTPARSEANNQIDLQGSNKILLLAGDPNQFAWVRQSYPTADLLQLAPKSSVEVIAEKLSDCSFDQLLWVAPNVDSARSHANEPIIDQQEAGVLAVFRIIKALLNLGYANKKLQWTIVTSRTQPVIQGEAIQSTHAAVIGLLGSLAKEYSRWDLRLLDLDSLAAATTQECLSLPWDKQGNPLAHRQGKWFQQGLTVLTTMPQGPPIYRQNGVYVVIGGAGGLGEVWTQFMMQQYQANVVWIGRRAYDATIEDKITNLLIRFGRAPLYISADATNLDALQQARKTILKKFPAIHGVVHSAIVLHDQSLARMDESGFRAGLSAKIDVSVNMDKVFGAKGLHFMLFFSSIISFIKSPGQSNYAAGSTFTDSFAQRLQQEGTYPVMIMNWGYWGNVGVAADEFHRKIMKQIGMGSIEPEEGMASLQALVSSGMGQVALIKTLDSQAVARFSLSEADRQNQQPVAKNIPQEASTRSVKGDALAAELAAPMPNCEIQRIITEKLSQALYIDAALIPVDASFTEFGVDSIIGVNLVRTLNETLGIEIPLEALFERTTVAALAEFIAELIPQTERSELPQLRPVDRTQFKRLPLSFAQERVWFFEQLEPDSPRYNLPQAVTIRGELNIDHLNQALNLIIARHENLRTVFPSQDGQAQQLILDSVEFKLERIDLTLHESMIERNRQARQLCQTDAATLFDLARGPLLRGKAIKLAEDEHILMLNMHHIVSDGWSLGVLIKELSLIMEALSQGRPPSLAPLPIQYVDYSVWQRTRLEEGGILKQQLAYWQEKLAGVREKLDLPTDYPRPSVRSFAGATCEFALDAQLTLQLKGLAENRGGTLYMILLAAFKVLLYRYSGQNDICVGTMIANRQHRETEGLIGMFVNTLALRSQVEGEDTFSALFSQVKATCLDAYERQDTPFEKIVDMLRPQRNPAINPIFQVMAILNNIVGAMDQRFPRYAFANETTELDLNAVFTETPEGLGGVIYYSPALHKPETIDRMGGHFVALCRAIIATPAARICDLDFIGEVEKHKLLVAYNATDVHSAPSYSRDKCIHELFAEQVGIHPGKIAVIDGDQEMTYQELYEKSHDLALYLQSMGVKPDSLVGLCGERSLDMIVGALGILHAGGAYMPLDPNCPDDQLAYMLQDSDAGIVLTQERFAYKLRSLVSEDARLISVDTHWPQIHKSAAAGKIKNVELRKEVNPGSVGYAIYASSASGKPKCVLMEHKALVSRLSWMQGSYCLDVSDAVLQKAPYSSDVSVWEMLWPLMAGASIVCAAAGRQNDVPYLESLINRRKVTTLHCYPSMLQTILENATLGCSTVKRVFHSGGACDINSVAAYKTKFPRASLYSLYGPTEAAVGVTALDCSQLQSSIISAGTPIDNTQIYILDQHDHLQPIGVTGELHISGDGLARGYLNRPELTAEQFPANPFVSGTRMYKTGDQGRWLDNGHIQLFSQIDASIVEAQVTGAQALEDVWWQEALLEDSYEKVTL